MVNKPINQNLVLQLGLKFSASLLYVVNYDLFAGDLREKHQRTTKTKGPQLGCSEVDLPP